MGFLFGQSKHTCTTSSYLIDSSWPGLQESDRWPGPNASCFCTSGRKVKLLPTLFSGRARSFLNTASRSAVDVFSIFYEGAPPTEGRGDSQKDAVQQPDQYHSDDKAKLGDSDIVSMCSLARRCAFGRQARLAALTKGA